MSEKDITAVLELLASRICHDIISPVGAVNNGVEFMEEMGSDGIDEAMNLISYSASQAGAKLRAFRLAYGAGGKDPNLKPEDVQKTFSDLVSAEGRVTQSWDPFGPLGPSPLPLGFCKMLMCTMMLAAEALPKGGTVFVKAGEEEQTLVIAEGEGATLRENVEEALQHKLDVSTLDPRLVHPYVVSMIAELYGFNVEIAENIENKVTFSLQSPKSI